VSSLAGIRAGLADALDAIPDLQVSAYMLAAPTPPCVHVFPGGPAGEIDYHATMGAGLEEWPFTVQLFVALTLDQGAQVNLDRYLESTGSYSVRAALEADLTLGGVVDNLFVRECTGVEVFKLDGRPPLLGAEWHVTVRAHR